MASQIKKGIFFCLLIFLLFNPKVFALDKKNSYALSRYIMATVYADLGDIDSAIQEYQKAIKADYQSAVLHLSLAASYVKKNETSKAIAELNLAAKFDQELVEPHAILALLYTAQGQPALAQAEYEIALQNASKLQPGNIEIYRSLGAIYVQQKKFKEAEGAYRLILDLSPDDIEAHFYLGSIYDALKDRARCMEELKKALQLKPDYPEALNYLGYLYVEENKNLDQAEVMIKKALEIEPNNGAYVDSLGWLYFKQGKLKEAVKELEKAISLLKDPVIYDHLGDAYLKLGDTEKAKLNWQKSLELDAQQKKVKEKLDNICVTPKSKSEN